jgi:hypothetical protein
MSCQNLSCNWFVKHVKYSLQFFIWILIYRMIGLWIFCMNFHMTWRILISLLLTCYMIWNLLLTYHMIQMSTQTLVVPMLWFLLIFLFWDVTIMKRLTSDNNDIRARPLVLTTITYTRVWVIMKDSRRRLEGGEWESIKIPLENSDYILKSIWRASLLAQPRPHSYRTAIGP